MRDQLWPPGPGLKNSVKEINAKRGDKIEPYKMCT